MAIPALLITFVRIFFGPRTCDIICISQYKVGIPGKFLIAKKLQLISLLRIKVFDPTQSKIQKEIEYSPSKKRKEFETMMQIAPHL